MFLNPLYDTLLSRISAHSPSFACIVEHRSLPIPRASLGSKELQMNQVENRDNVDHMNRYQESIFDCEQLVLRSKKQFFCILIFFVEYRSLPSVQGIICTRQRIEIMWNMDQYYQESIFDREQLAVRSKEQLLYRQSSAYTVL